MRLRNRMQTAPALHGRQDYMLLTAPTLHADVLTCLVLEHPV